MSPRQLDPNAEVEDHFRSRIHSTTSTDITSRVPSDNASPLITSALHLPPPAPPKSHVSCRAERAWYLVLFATSGVRQDLSRGIRARPGENRESAPSAGRLFPSSHHQNTSSLCPSAPPTPIPVMASTPVDPVLRNALRYTISTREYAALHKYILSRSKALRLTVPSPAAVEKALQVQAQSSAPEQQQQQQHRKGLGGGGDDYNVRAVRHALRVFLATLAGMKGWEAVVTRLGGGRGAKSKPSSGSGSPALRLSASLSGILLLYRFLFRFLSRLRAQLLDAQAEPFRVRNPRTAAALTSPFAPAVGASLAGFALGVCPAEKKQQLRVSIALFALFRALEFAWDLCEAEGRVWGFVTTSGSLASSATKREKRERREKRARPWWFGSWLLQPLAFGQLLHAVVFDRDCFPASYGRFIFGHSAGYLHASPAAWSAPLAWPSTDAVVESLAHMARLHWPAYVSPTMFPHKQNQHQHGLLPASLQAIAPLTAQAHPLITSLSCATLHPSDPSCSRTLLTFWLNTLPRFARFFLVLYAGLALVLSPRRLLPSLYHAPLSTLTAVFSRALRTSVFATGAISTAWSSICFFQSYLPRRVLPTQRFFLGGFLAGLWASILDRRHGRPIFLSSARLSLHSLWRVGLKRRWWRAVRAGDVAVFVAALMITGVAYERDARSAVRDGQWRKGISWLRGEGWRDWTVGAVDEDGENGKGD
ncbi:hypothetical protein E4U21_006330 [Claviceps maximensis]|nr:hypothetical protein E4U21_006330 [Claviceps maximensis]